MGEIKLFSMLRLCACLVSFLMLEMENFSNADMKVKHLIKSLKLCMYGVAKIIGLK